MNRSDSRDSAGQSADDVLKTSKHHDLRNRIAAVLYGYVDHGHRYDLADMLIRELGLTRRTGQGP